MCIEYRFLFSPYPQKLFFLPAPTRTSRPLPEAYTDHPKEVAVAATLHLNQQYVWCVVWECLVGAISPSASHQILALSNSCSICASILPTLYTLILIGQPCTPMENYYNNDFMKAPLSTRLVFSVVGLAGKVHNGLYARSLTISGYHQALLKAIFNRPLGVPLLTISNHTSAVDDPLLWSALLPSSSVFFDNRSSTRRWVLGAEELCYTNWAMSAMMRAGRVIPVRRGQGIYQPAMDQAISLLSRGDWVHVFVEGRIGEGNGKLHRPIRWGVGRMVMESIPAPVIVPIAHFGVEKVVSGRSWWPRRCGMDIRVGPPMDGGILQQALPPGNTAILRAALTRYLEDRLADLYNGVDDPLVDWNSHKMKQYE